MERFNCDNEGFGLLQLFQKSFCSGIPCIFFQDLVDQFPGIRLSIGCDEDVCQLQLQQRIFRL